MGKHNAPDLNFSTWRDLNDGTAEAVLDPLLPAPHEGLVVTAGDRAWRVERVEFLRGGERRVTLREE